MVSRCFIREPGPPFNKSFPLSFGGNFHALWKSNQPILCELLLLLSLFSQKFFVFGFFDESFERWCDILGRRSRNTRPEFALKISFALHHGIKCFQHEKKREKPPFFHFIFILATYIYLLIYNKTHSFLERHALISPSSISRVIVFTRTLLFDPWFLFAFTEDETFSYI